jgi:lipoprotein-anchoring transpeptidase ErfK/SrfK
LNSILTALALAASVTLAAPEARAECHWWQFGECSDSAAGLPDEAPRIGVVITIDVSTNRAYLFRDGKLIAKSGTATGSGKEFVYGNDIWVFHTPRGHLKVLGKIKDPIWRKPDWAFHEAGEKVPSPNSPVRNVKGKLGKYALDLGEGILIHGTDDPKSIGQRVSHGCIRLPDKMMAKVYDAATVGTDVYVFDSQRPTERAPSRDIR